MALPRHYLGNYFKLLGPSPGPGGGQVGTPGPQPGIGSSEAAD